MAKARFSLLSASKLLDIFLVYDYFYISQSRGALRKYKKYTIIKPSLDDELSIKYPVSLSFVGKTGNSVAYADANISYSRNKIFLPILAIFLCCSYA